MEQTQSVSTNQEEGTLRPTGDLTIFEAARFHADLVTLQRQEGPLQLDLTEVDRVDSSCVQLIVAATRSGRLTLWGYSQGIRDKFEQIGFAQFLPTHESCDSTN
jgi:anti-anti-sigma factor